MCKRIVVKCRRKYEHNILHTVRVSQARESFFSVVTSFHILKIMSFWQIMCFAGYFRFFATCFSHLRGKV